MVAQPLQPMALVALVAHLDHGILIQLLLYVEYILEHIRNLPDGIICQNVGLRHAVTRPVGANSRHGGEGVGQRLRVSLSFMRFDLGGRTSLARRF